MNRGIIFTAESVAAIRKQRKTQTRRTGGIPNNAYHSRVGWLRGLAIQVQKSTNWTETKSVICRYGKPGDRALGKGTVPRCLLTGMFIIGRTLFSSGPIICQCTRMTSRKIGAGSLRC